mgnify:CR=1 FL=1
MDSQTILHQLESEILPVQEDVEKKSFNGMSTEDIAKMSSFIEAIGKMNDIQLRKNFAYRIFVFVCFYMAAVLAVVICSGFTWLTISDTILGVLLGTTTVDVVGLLAIVVKYLFHTKVT